MTAYSKTTPIGIDKIFDRIQSSMEMVLPTEWGVSASICKFYGRADENEEIFEWNSGNNSIPLGYDNKCFTSYFVVNYPVEEENGLNVADVDLICHANIKLLYPTLSHAGDSEIINSILKILNRHLDVSGGYEIIKTAYPEVSFKLNFETRYHA